MDKHLEKMRIDMKSKPFYKQVYNKILSWVNKSDFLLVFSILIVTWPVALSPSGLFYFLWYLLNPETFWAKFVMILLIGGPFLIPQVILLFVAIVITVDALSRFFK